MLPGMQQAVVNEQIEEYLAQFKICPHRERVEQSGFNRTRLIKLLYLYDERA